jgi:hypothetical protein
MDEQWHTIKARAWTVAASKQARTLQAVEQGFLLLGGGNSIESAAAFRFIFYFFTVGACTW